MGVQTPAADRLPAGPAGHGQVQPFDTAAARWRSTSSASRSSSACAARSSSACYFERPRPQLGRHVAGKRSSPRSGPRSRSRAADPDPALAGAGRAASCGRSPPAGCSTARRCILGRRPPRPAARPSRRCRRRRADPAVAPRARRLRRLPAVAPSASRPRTPPGSRPTSTTRSRSSPPRRPEPRSCWRPTFPGGHLDWYSFSRRHRRGRLAGRSSRPTPASTSCPCT